MDLYKLPFIVQTAGVVLGDAFWSDWDVKVREEVNKRMSRKRSMSTILSGDASPSQSHLSDIIGDTNANTGGSQSSGVAGGFSVVGAASIARLSSMGSVGSQHDTVVDTPNVGIHTQQAQHDISGEQDMDIEIVWPHAPQHGSDMQLVGVSQQPDGAGTVAFTESTNLKFMDDHNRKAFLDTQSKDELVSLYMNQLKQMDKLRMSLDTSIKTRRYWNQVARRLQQQLHKQKERLKDIRNQDDDDLQVKPKNSRRMNWKGMIALGLRKGMTLVSANAFPQASLLDVSRQSVYRAEILCGAYFITRMFAFHQLLYTLLNTFASIQQEAHNPTRPINADSDDTLVLVNTETRGGTMNYQISQDDLLCAELGLPSAQPTTFQKMLLTVQGNSILIGSTYFCGDATNSSIWQRQKLQGLMVKSALLTDWDALKNLRYQNAFSCMTSMFQN